MQGDYVHGYGARESERLCDQADILAELLHGDTHYPAGSRVLEAGCGVGAQTIYLARANPEARFTCVDLSAESLEQARARAREASLENVSFEQADLLRLPPPQVPFDHVFVCFVLEHLPSPADALARLRAVLRPGGTITVIEGDHGSAFFHPESALARRAIEQLVALQAEGGGDANVGRRLYPLLSATGFAEVTVSPRTVYADASRPAWVKGFTRDTFTAMVEGVREPALARGWMRPDEWEEAIAGLRRAAGSDGVFCYTFFKAVARRGAEEGGP